MTASRLTLKGVVALANSAVAAVLVAVIAAQAVADRERVIESSYRHAENLTSALAEHTRQATAAIDLGLQTMVEAARENTRAGRIDASTLQPLLAQRQRASPSTFAYFVLDAEGRLTVSSSDSAAPEPLEFSDLPEFRVHRHRSGDQLYIGAPHKGRVGPARGRWTVNITRRLELPGGRFAGVVVASASVEQLLEFYDALRLGEQGAVGLINMDGVLVARGPLVDHFIGQDLSHTPSFRNHFSRFLQGRFTTTYSTDGIERISAFRRVEGAPAVVYVGLGRHEVLAPWRQRLLFQSAMGALAMVMFLATSMLVARLLTRRQEEETRRSSRLRAIAQMSGGLARSPGVEQLLERATDFARCLLDAGLAVSTLRREGAESAVHAVSAADRHARWRDDMETWASGALQQLVCEANRPMRLSRAETERHPQWARPVPGQDDRPRLHGWLAVPLVAQDGRNLGLMQLADKDEGEFSADDQNEMMLLASIVGACVENLLAREAREAAMAQARAASERIENIFASISDAVYALDAEWRFVYLNDEAERLLRRKRAELIGKNVWKEFPEAVQSPLYPAYHRVREDRVPARFEFFYDPLQTWFSVRAFPHDGGLTVYFQDITRKVETEERLRQAQKMDALGQLTGGVAHDFNNLLTVILSAVDTLDHEHSAAAPGPRAQIELIRQASERAAVLTRRLLAFARKQPLDPRRTDVNELLGDFEPLLRRSLGEDIDIELVRGGGLWKALVDPNELQNAILNLAINARDAMPEGGRLTIETANVSIDRGYAEQHDIQAGQYVMVAVSDTGTGMSPEVAARAFDPFFTTKGPGRGSGLGLSMVYGFARQSGGHVKIYSEPGQGTTVKLYLPRVEAGADEEDYHARAPLPVSHGNEHVLLVEDDDLVRLITVTSLQRLGYRVTECASGSQALAQLTSGQPFDLLLTDVILAGGISGRQVAEQAMRLRPRLKVLYMSGYTENAIVHHGRLDRGVHLLGKPFRLDELGRKVREALDET